MKQLITIILLVLAVNASYSQSNVPNGDFETWYNVVVNPSLNYDDIGAGPTDNWLATLNSLAMLPPSAMGPGPVTVFKTDDKYSGTYAAKAVSANFPLGSFTIFIPGMIGTAIMDNANIRALLGKPCADCKPLRFKGYYKYDPVEGDSCAALVLLSKWNTVTKKRDTIGYGKMVEHNKVETYQQFDIPITYTGTGSVDTMTMLIVSSAGFNVVNFMGSMGQVGSTMYVDALSLEYAAGIEQVLLPEVSVSVYPNPASDILKVRLSKAVKNGTLAVYNVAGKLVGTYQVSKTENSIPVYSLVNGTYHFRLMSGNEMLNTGSFVIKK